MREKYILIKEDLIDLAANLENRDEYDLTIKNSNALNSNDVLNYLVVKVNKGNLKTLVDGITKLYNFTAEIDDENKTILFKTN
jgi:hypothetical protein